MRPRPRSPWPRSGSTPRLAAAFGRRLRLPAHLGAGARRVGPSAANQAQLTLAMSTGAGIARRHGARVSPALAAAPIGVALVVTVTWVWLIALVSVILAPDQEPTGPRRRASAPSMSAWLITSGQWWLGPYLMVGPVRADRSGRGRRGPLDRRQPYRYRSVRVRRPGPARGGLRRRRPRRSNSADPGQIQPPTSRPSSRRRWACSRRRPIGAGARLPGRHDGAAGAAAGRAPRRRSSSSSPITRAAQRPAAPVAIAAAPSGGLPAAPRGRRRSPSRGASCGPSHPGGSRPARTSTLGRGGRRRPAGVRAPAGRGARAASPGWTQRADGPRRGGRGEEAAPTRERRAEAKAAAEVEGSRGQGRRRGASGGGRGRRSRPERLRPGRRRGKGGQANHQRTRRPQQEAAKVRQAAEARPSGSRTGPAGGGAAGGRRARRSAAARRGGGAVPVAEAERQRGRSRAAARRRRAPRLQADVAARAKAKSRPPRSGRSREPKREPVRVPTGPTHEQLRTRRRN